MPADDRAAAVDVKLADYLAAVGLRAENVRNCQPDAPDALWRSVHKRSATDVPRLLRALDAVLAQHRPEVSNVDGKLICAKDSFAFRTLWPCGEYEAITRELLGEGNGDG